MNYLITFTATAKNYSEIVEKIKNMGEWGEVTPSSFLVVSNENAGAITENFQLLLGQQDSFAVFSVSKPLASYSDIIVEDFILSKIGEDEDWVIKNWNEETQSWIS